MGKLNEMGFTLLQGVPEGTCPECAVKHPQEQPHNRDSLFYQYKFYDEYGRWPKWEDAMAHCPEEIKKFWIGRSIMREIKNPPATSALRTAGVGAPCGG